MGKAENAQRVGPRLSFQRQPDKGEAQDKGGSEEVNQPGSSQRQQTELPN